ncbi:DUF4190 domain-containing protein [Polymorphospora sp. NPDC051019]|uniref:DUF4190 domain-containing protein n=1 Tax=Polymorphospora sp. NPDC051019 TaxID=3155725 RepID=UPI003434BF4B
MDKPDGEPQATGTPGATGTPTPGPASLDKPGVPPGPADAGRTVPGPARPVWPGPVSRPFAPLRPTNTLAVTALVIALVSLATCPLIGGVAVYLGNRARAEIRSSGEQGDGLALAGVIVGWCAIALSAVLLLFMVAYFGFLAIMFGAMFATGV